MKAVIKQAVFCTTLILSLWGFSAQAAVTFVGNDIATGSSWRTPGVTKPNDIDGDNVYGSAGYFLPSGKQFGYRNPLLVGTNVITPDPKGINAMPSYITDLEFTNAEVGSSWGGEFGDCGTLDTVPGSIGFTGAGIMPSLAGTNVLNLKLKRSSSPAFRLTLIFGNNPNPLTFFETSAISENTTVTGNAGIPNNDDPLGMDVTLDDGSGPVSQLSGDPSLSINTAGYTTYQSWDIPAGSSDISITIDLAGTTNTVPRLSGLAFDSLPVTQPTVLIQPVGGTYFVGNPFTLSVNAGGTGIGYQWLKNSNIIAGATTDIFTVTNAVATNSGNYQVVITNSAGSVTSIVAAISVLAPPVTVIYSDTMGNSAATLNGRVPDTTDTGSATWTAATTWNTDGSEAAATTGTGLAFLPFTPQPGRIYTLSADIENFDISGNNWTALGFANGTDVVDQWHTVNSPVGWFLARGDNSPPPNQDNQAFIGPYTGNGQAFNYAPTAMTHYQIILDTTPSSSANWTFTYLANGTVYVPATVFGGSGPTITTVGFGNEGASTSHVMNFVLSQQVPFAAPFITLQPVGGTNFVGETKTLSAQVGGSDPLTYQWQKNSNNIPNATNLVFTLNNLQTSDAGSYRVIVTNPQGSTNSVGAFVQVIAPVVNTIYQDNFSYVTSSINGNFPDTTGNQPWIANGQWGSDGTEAWASTTNNHSANAFLPFIPQAGNVYTLSAAIDCTNGSWLALGYANGTDVNDPWHTVNSPVGWGLIRPDDGENNQVFIGPGTAGQSGTVVTPHERHTYAMILDTRPASRSAWTFTFQTDGTNVSGPTAFGGSGPTISTVGFGSLNTSGGTVTNFTLTAAYSTSNSATVLTQPVGGTYLIGSSATLSAYAGGSAPLTYQWQKNSNNIAGATSPQLTLTNLGLADSGYYRLLVSNPTGSSASTNAFINVVSSIPVVVTTFDAGDVLPSIPVNTGINNLILNNLASVNPAASGNNFTGTYMRNGTTGTAHESSTANPANIMNIGTYDFIFDTSVNTNGYDIASVVTYSGWADRAGQEHTVYYRQVGSATFNLLTTVSNPSPGDGSLREAITNSAGGILASHVNAIRVVLNNRSYYVYREIEVDGTPSALATVAPTLTIQPQGSSVLISWPASATGFGLTGSAALGAGASWQSAGGTPTVVNGTNEVTIPVTNSAQFFRLVK